MSAPPKPTPTETSSTGTPTLVLSHYELAPALQAWQQGRHQTTLTVDLGLERVPVTLTPQGIVFPQGWTLPWDTVQHILEQTGLCFRVTPEGAEPLRRFSPLTQRAVQLYPTGRAPTVLLSGVAMHRVRGIDPWEDTQRKIRAARPRGRVLDTCTGLGYTAILAARQARWVVTVELDPAVLDLARQNPWSRPLFESPNIAQIHGDVFDLVVGFPQGYFDVVIHDPPAMALAGDLYGRPFYRELYRVLRPGGRLFHYIGNPQTPTGRNITRGVMERLRQVGFRQLRKVPHAFGVIAVKSAATRA